ncbi:MAG: T9SS type A sorting domain-containing protein [Bacteroidia bacterium]|nr:MAG: T9SS type A sorting domain-containing protein [Bacteroidia bacterium]
MCSLALNTAIAQPPGAAVIIPPTPFPEKNIAPVTSLPKPHFYQPVINCDMLEVGKEEIGEDGFPIRNVLKAIAWDNGTYPGYITNTSCPSLCIGMASPAPNQSYIYVEDWNGNNITLPLPIDSKKPDIVLANDMTDPDNSYLVGVVYMLGGNLANSYCSTPPVFTCFHYLHKQMVILDVYRVSNAGTPGISITPTPIATQILADWSTFGLIQDIDLIAYQGHPHIDMWSDNQQLLHGRPTMHRFAAVWSMGFDATQPMLNISNVFGITGEIDQPATSWTPSPLLVAHDYTADVACLTETGTGNRFMEIISTNNSQLHYTEWQEIGAGTFVSSVAPTTLSNGSSSLLPRIEAMSQHRGIGVRWQAVAVEPGIGGHQVWSYNNIAAPQVISYTYNPPLDTKGGAVAAGLGVGVGLATDVGNQQYTTGFFAWNDNYIFSRNIHPINGIPISNNFYQVNNAPINAVWDVPQLYAVSNCSNSGYGLLSAWSTETDIVYKYSGNTMAFKPTGINNTNNTKTVYQVYPNTATSTLMVKGLNVGIAYTINDLTGRTISSGLYANSIDVASLAKGFYTISFSENNRKRTLHFNKQ